MEEQNIQQQIRYRKKHSTNTAIIAMETQNVCYRLILNNTKFLLLFSTL